MKTLQENPADQLSTIVVHLFQLAGDTRITPKSKRDMIFESAHKLHGYSVTLAKEQFTENSKAYQEAMDNIKKINGGLMQAKEDIKKIVKTIEDLGKLVSAVEKLVIAVGGVVT